MREEGGLGDALAEGKRSTHEREAREERRDRDRQKGGARRQETTAAYFQQKKNKAKIYLSIHYQNLGCLESNPRSARASRPLFETVSDPCFCRSVNRSVSVEQV